MDIRILDSAEAQDIAPGELALEVTLDLDDVTMLRGQAHRAFEIEQSLPAAARTALGNADETAYASDFIETRAVNDALEARGIIPVAAPHVHSNAGHVGTEPFTCAVRVHPRPEIGLTSLDPVDLATNRIAKPGFSLKAGREGADGVEFLDDVKVLRMAMTERLDSEVPESAMRALGDEYQEKFERELAARGSDPETYQATHQIDEEQYALMLTRRALADARWNFTLDAAFVATGLAITEEDLLAAFEADFPGWSDQLMELHELRNDLSMTVEKVRRAKALDWLLANAIK